MKQTFIEQIERLKEYTDTVGKIDELLDANCGEGVMGHMIDDIGDLLLKLVNPDLKDVHLDYFSEALWSKIYADEAIDWGAFYDEIQGGKAPEEYVRRYHYCYN